MSLVGSLEDLGLGEILQIVSLSGKSGVLHLRSDAGDGRIVFQRGLIRGAFTKESPSGLDDLLRASGVDRAGIASERIEELRRQAVEAAVLQMFSWRSGEFSFEIGEAGAAAGPVDLLLASGINAQFLALEGSRVRDESAREGDSGAGAEVAVASESGVLEAPDELVTTALELVEAEVGDELETLEPLEDEVAVAEDEPTLGGARAASPPRAAVAPLSAAPIIAVDPERVVLEWVKGALAELGGRVHIFQRSEQAIARIRQYLTRFETPVVLLTTETPADPVSGSGDWSEIAVRLRAQVRDLPIVLLASSGAGVEPASELGLPDAVCQKPDMTVLCDARASERREAHAERLRAALAGLRRDASPASAPRSAHAGVAS
jgi:Domain of unknown function (DUF4388)